MRLAIRPRLRGAAGAQLEAEHMAGLLSKMQLTAKAVDGGKAVQVQVPITRSDVLHGVSPAPPSAPYIADVCSMVLGAY